MKTTGKEFRIGLTALAIAVSIAALPALAGHTNTVLATDLNGREEVAGDGSNALVGDPNGRGEAYVFGIDGDELTLCYLLLVNKIQLVPVGEGMAAHIHEGARGTNGPVVAVLAGPEDGNAADCLTEGEPGKFPTGEMGIVDRILDNPEDFYINVHNPQFPAGAVRGQLARVDEPRSDDPPGNDDDDDDSDSDSDSDSDKRLFMNLELPE